MVAAQAPHLIDSVIAKKHEGLNDPDMVRLYSLINGSLDCPPDDPRVVEIADVLERLMIRAVEAGETGDDHFDDQFADLLYVAAGESSPAAKRLLAILQERGWKSWTRRGSRCGWTPPRPVAS